MKSIRPALWVLGSIFVLAFVGSCDSSSPSSPSMTSTTTSSTTTTSTTTTSTTSSTTTTTSPTSTTTTSTTTTTQGLIAYDSQVHPIWAAQNCTDCHNAGGNPLNLDGSASATCGQIAARDGANPSLVITGGSANQSQLLTKPQGMAHAGGAFSCFGGSGDACYDTVLAWLQQGANGPGGMACGG